MLFREPNGAELIRLDLPRRPFPPPVPAQNGNGKGHASPEKKYSIRQYDFSDFWIAGNPLSRWEPGDVRGRTAYAAAALAYICINYRAAKISEAPLMVVEESKSGEEWIEDHELNDLLANPNDDFGMRRMMEATEIYVLTTGSALWLKERDNVGRTAALYVYSGDEFTVKSNGRRLTGEFVIRTQRGERKFGPDRVVYFNEFNPTDPQSGLAPLDAALNHLNLGQQLHSRVKDTLRNAARPSGILNLDKDVRLDDDQFNRLKNEINEASSGVNSGRVVIAEGGGKLDKVSLSLQELAMGELWKEVEAIVCGCFKVPAALVGTVIGITNSPWSHLETMKRSFYDETAIPRWSFYEEPITKQLLRDVDDDASHLIRFDTSRIRALQIDLLRKAQEASTAGRFWTVNEARLHTGLPPLPEGDERGNQFVLLSAAPSGDNQTPIDNNEVRGPNAPANAQ